MYDIPCMCTNVGRGVLHIAHIFPYIHFVELDEWAKKPRGKKEKANIYPELNHSRDDTQSSPKMWNGNLLLALKFLSDRFHSFFQFFSALQNGALAGRPCSNSASSNSIEVHVNSRDLEIFFFFKFFFSGQCPQAMPRAFGMEH